MFSVLIVEDDNFYRALLLRHLAATGYHVEVAAGRGAAVRRMLNKHFDVVVLNIRSVVDVDGLGIIPIIQHVNPNIPIVAMTSDTSLAVQQAVREKEAFCLFVKPFDVEEMVLTIKDAARTGQRSFDIRAKQSASASNEINQ